MAIERIVVPYEILFRLSQDGTVSGCHRRDIELVKDNETGNVYSAKELDPSPITGELMDGVLGLVNTSLVASLAVAETEIASQNLRLTEARDNGLALAAENSSMAQQLANAEARIIELEELNAGTE